MCNIRRFGFDKDEPNRCLVLDKWKLAPLKYPFGNGINFQLEVENVDEIYKKLEAMMVVGMIV